jgi:hypothetical protein
MSSSEKMNSIKQATNGEDADLNDAGNDTAIKTSFMVIWLLLIALIAPFLYYSNELNRYGRQN